MSEPTTAAGRALFEAIGEVPGRPLDLYPAQKFILAIEAEAAAAERAATAPQIATFRKAVLILSRLDMQSQDGGGARAEVYMTVQTWRAEVYPVLRDALHALAILDAREPKT